MKTSELRKLLKAQGCEYSGTKGSHEKWTAPGGHSTVFKAGVKEQKVGTLRGIQSHLAPELGEHWIEEAQ